MKNFKTISFFILFFSFNNINLFATNDTLVFFGDRNLYPYEFINSKGEEKGFDVDIFKAIAEIINYETDVRLLSLEESLKSINDKKKNAVVCYVYSKKRSEKYSFSKPFNVISYFIFTRKNLIINTLNDIRDKSIIVQKGGITEDYLIENNYSPNIIPVEDQESALKLLSSGKNDCAYLSYLNAVYFIKKLNLNNLRVSISAFPSKEYCFATNKNDTLLISKINNALEIIKQNGKYDEIYNRWFGQLEKEQLNKSVIRIFIILGILLFIISIIVLLWIWLLRRQVKQKTFEIHKELENRKKIQDQLVKREKQIRQLIDLVPHPIFAKDETNNLILINKAAADFIGFSHDKLLVDKKISYKELKNDYYINIFKKLKYSDKKQFLSKYSIKDTNSDEKIFNITAIPYTEYSSNEKATLVIALDITAQNKIENSLIREESILHSIIHSIPDLVFYKDIDGKYLGANSAFLDFNNFNYNDFIGKTDYDLYEKSIADCYFQSDSEVLIEKKTLREELWVTNINGDKVFFDIIKNLFVDDSNNILGTIGICRDITERYESSKLLKEAKNKAEDADRLKTAFLANMSHEIRTPMNSIIGFSDLLTDPDLETKQKEEYLHLINKSGITLLNLIDDILDLSKIEAGQVIIKKSECRLNKMMNDLYYSFDEIKKNQLKNNVTLSLETENNEENLTIVTDGFRLKQILTNLLGNALKFTEEGYLKFGYTITEDNFLQFFVKDSGIGISKDEQNLIFNRFNKLRSSTNKKGSGLGLTISKNLVELLGGKIWVNSVNKKGATFYFTIPFIKISSTKELKKKLISSDKLNWENKTILIAEDNESNYILIKEILRKTKAKLLWAKNGQEAVDFCRNTNIDAVLMDIKMPVLNGIEATKQIKFLKKEIPIIVQTAYAMADEKEKILNCGCDGYLSKPIIYKELISSLKEFL